MKRAEMTSKDWAKVDMLLVLRHLRRALNGKYDIGLSDFVTEYDLDDEDVVDLDSDLIGCIFTWASRGLNPDFTDGVLYYVIRSAGIDLDAYFHIVEHAEFIALELDMGRLVFTVEDGLKEMRLLRDAVLQLV